MHFYFIRSFILFILFIFIFFLYFYHLFYLLALFLFLIPYSTLFLFLSFIFLLLFFYFFNIFVIPYFYPKVFIRVSQFHQLLHQLDILVPVYLQLLDEILAISICFFILEFCLVDKGLKLTDLLFKIEIIMNTNVCFI